MKKNLMIATAFICCAMLSFAITGYAQADKTGNTGNDISDSVPTVEVSETVTTAPKSTVKHTNIRDTESGRSDTIRSKKPSEAGSSSGSSAGTSGSQVKSGAKSDSAGTADQSSQVQVYPEKYEMNLTLDTANKKLSGTVTVRLRNNTDSELSMFCLRNYAASVLSQNGGKSSDAVITGVESLLGTKLQINKGKDPSVLYVLLGDNGIDASESDSFVISFSEKIPKLDDRYGYHVGTDGTLQFQLTYCFPCVATYQDGKWDENPYFYAGETACSPCTDYTAVLKVPKDYNVISTGTSVKNGDSVRINAKSVRDMAIVASNHMRCDSTELDGKKINLYYLTDNSNSSSFRKYVMAAASDSMTTFSKEIGEYAYDELDVVESYLPGGMEYPGLVMINTSADNKKASYSDLCTLTAHEIGHEWFYAAVGNDQYEEAWLDEGLATFLEKGVYASSGDSTLAAAVKLDKSNKVTPVKTWNSEDAYDKYTESTLKSYKDSYYINLPYDSFSSDDSYTEHVYDGGCIFVSALREEMGSVAFDNALKDYYKTYKYGIATTDDFVSMIRKYDPTGKTQDTIDIFIKQ